jgi:hypothetical protein
MVVWLVVIWFFAIFGFQILLKVVEKPTPEQSYLTFENVWENVKSDSPGDKELKEFGQIGINYL